MEKYKRIVILLSFVLLIISKFQVSRGHQVRRGFDLFPSVTTDLLSIYNHNIHNALIAQHPSLTLHTFTYIPIAMYKSTSYQPSPTRSLSVSTTSSGCSRPPNMDRTASPRSDHTPLTPASTSRPGDLKYGWDEVDKVGYMHSLRIAWVISRHDGDMG